MNWAISRAARLNAYLHQLDRHIVVNKKVERELIDLLISQMKSHINRMRIFLGLRAVLYVLLYASVVASIAGVNPVLKEFISYIVLVSGVISSTIIIIGIAILSKIIGLIWEDIRTFSSHIISIYVKNDHEKHEGLMEFVSNLG